MRRKLLFIFALLSSHLSLVTSECPPGARGLNREGKLVCVELSEVNLRFPVITLYPLLFICLLQDRRSWYRAKRKCIGKGRRLLELHSDQEAAQIIHLYPRLNFETSGVWIGGENHAYVRTKKHMTSY